MSYKKILYATLFIILLAVLCIIYLSYTNKELTYSYYHWKNSYEFKNNQDKLYIKVLDIDYSTKLEVISTKFLTNPNKNFIPVIYISNEAVKKASLASLSRRVLKELNSLNYSYKEIQFDCDWSLSTRAKYFTFLDNIKTNTGKILSATIRLHQIKYAKKTGVPPVTYGVLMYYNMSNIRDYNTKNSILDNDIAKKYHANFDVYPLKLKLALPLYSQAIQFRQKKALSIFEGVKEKDFQEHFTQKSKNYYEVNKSFYFQGRYVYKGDIFRYEDTHFKELEVAMNDFFNVANNPFDEVIFYTLEYKNKYNLNLLKK